MSVKVNVTSRRVMAGVNKGAYRYYGRPKARGTVTFGQLCERISQFSAATQGDVELVLNSLLIIIREHLSMGNVVQLSGLGKMRINVGSKGADSEDQFHVSLMKKARLLFAPGARLREMLNEVRFEHQDAKKVVSDEPCEEEHDD